MPAEITPTTTNNLEGKISYADVHRIIQDFKINIDLTSKESGRNPVGKYYSFDLSFRKLRDIAKKSKGSNKSKVRIYLVQNLPGQMDCTNSYTIENKLSILVCAVAKDNASFLEVGDHVLADGFKESVAFGTECCVQGDPPHISGK